MSERKGSLKKAFDTLRGHKPAFAACVLLLALALALLADLALWHLQPAHLTYRQEEPALTLAAEEGSPSGCVITEGLLTPTSLDPQLCFETADAGEIEGVMVRFSLPTAQETLLQVFYIREGEERNQQNSLICQIAPGVTQSGVNLPRGEYASLIFGFWQPVPVESIGLSAGAVQHAFLPYALTRQTAALALAALLCALILLSPARRGAAAAYDALLNPRTRSLLVDLVYAALLAGMVFFHFFVTLYYPEVISGTQMLRIPWLLLGFAALLLGQTWKDRGFWALAALWLFMFLRVYIPMPERLNGTLDPLYNSFFAFFVCYTAARAIRPQLHRIFLRILCAVWSAGTAALCCLGVYAAWTGSLIPNLSTSYIGICPTVSDAAYQRLVLVYYPTTSASITSLGVGVALLGGALAPKRWAKIAYACAVPPMLAACGLTGTRTAYLLNGFSLGLLAALLLRQRLQARKKGPGGLSLREKLTPPLAFLLVFAALTLGQLFLVDAFNAARSAGLVLPRALAESAALEIKHRGFLGKSLESVLSGRTRIWQATVTYLFSNPLKLLTGQSVLDTLRPVNAIVTGKIVFDHCHNLLLQTALESGLPGLALQLLLLIPFCVKSFRLFFRPKLPLWKRLIPLPALVILIGEMVEVFTLLRSGLPALTFLYLFIGFTMAVKLPKKAR